MSDSRLEKFIYAICSMDVSDLPVPLSRIEKLWNCLITGETPDFEPLSRNEKYLMAMLDRYDISNLPAPMSRGEKLLYKIAVGETDLSDVPGYLSRYEELLKYLIENGGISGGDFEYVLYTLNQSVYTLYATAEKPVKSAILKGKTLVNVNRSNYTAITNITTDYGQAIEFYDTDMLPNTTYSIIMYSDNPYECRFSQMYDDREYALSVIKVGTPFVFTTAGNYQGLRSYLKGDELNIPQGTEIKILIIEGDYTNIDIPYFEGMQSVKMPVLKTTGKNLVIKPQYGYVANGVINAGVKAWINSDYIYVKGLKEIVDSTSNVIDGTANIATYNKNKQLIRALNGQYKATLNDDEYYVVFSRRKLDNSEITQEELLNSQMQLEIGTIPTTYEPYKSNILTCNEDVTLRSNGNICDELNLLTGQLTQRIDEDGEVLSQEVVKTVDLTIVDQDNQPTQLGTFENVTHVSLVAENLIPEVELEVATRISEELASASPLMDDISTEQQQLNTTVDEQSENVDATMIATTEIFEEIL